MTLLFVLCGGCGGDDTIAAPASPPERVEAYGLAMLAASRSYEALAIAPSGAILARDSTGRTLLFPASARKPRELFHEPRLEALALFPDGARVLVEERAATPGEASRLFRLEATGARTPLPLALSRPRFLGWRADGGAFFVAGRRRDAESGESLFEVASDALATSSAGDFPPGFRVEAVAGDGKRLALRRELHPEADELYVAERARAESAAGEMRLVLPADADARFRPSGFSPDGARLLLLTDERSERLEIEWLDVASGNRVRLPSPECEPIAARLANEAAVVVAILDCDGARRIARLDAVSGAALPQPPLPAETRPLDLLVGPGATPPSVWVVGSARLPRDLLRQAAPDAALDPLTWGLAPGVDPARLSSPSIAHPGSGATPPIETWPDAPPKARAGVIWIEGDASAPAWNEFDPLFQFLAGRGVAVTRLRLRGSDGFGRAFRHAADGATLAAAVADIDAARRALTDRGVDAGRLALVGVGGWPGAVVASLATGGAGEAPRFAAYAAFGADPDPLARLDAMALLPEPAKSWWAARLGVPADALAPPAKPPTHAQESRMPRGLLDARLATRADRRSDPALAAPLAPLLEGGGEPLPEALWRHLEPRLTPP